MMESVGALQTSAKQCTRGRERGKQTDRQRGEGGGRGEREREGGRENACDYARVLMVMKYRKREKERERENACDYARIVMVMKYRSRDQEGGRWCVANILWTPTRKMSFEQKFESFQGGCCSGLR